MTDDKASIFNRLRRLQEHSLSLIPAMMMQKAMSSFTLQEEPEPEELLGQVSVVVYPQDPFVGGPEVRRMSARDLRPGLVNARVRIQDSRGETAQPDEEGNYLYWPGSREFDQINSFYYTTFTLRMYERYARRALPWSFPAPRITVDPHSSDGANAFYNEQDRLLGFHSLDMNGEVISSAQSADIISHETAHAILDGLRDLYNESFGLGPTAFHEAFGDISAMLVALHDDSLISRVLDWTGGDLRLDNFVTTVGEQLTERLRTMPQVNTHTIYLRNALNKLSNLAFDQLTYAPADPEFVLARESHNFSRLFSGAFYDIVVGIYELLKQEVNPRIAIHRARDMMGYLLVAAIELGPVGEFDFSDMARACLAAENMLHDGKYASILMDVFNQRGILGRAEAEAWRSTLKALPDLRLPESINSSLSSGTFLEEKVIAALGLSRDAELIPLSAYRNASGTAYLTYFSHKRISLEGSQFLQFNGSHIDVFGGLTLTFDAENRLRSAFYRPVSDEDVRQIRILTADLIQFGLIVSSTGTVAPPTPLHLYHAHPKGLWLPNTPLLDSQPTTTGQAKLVKFPVIFDTIPRHLSDFWTYLKAWKK
jgi:hypothetical protein